MNELRIGLCDQDGAYITMFASYMLEHFSGVQLHIFTTPESFYSDSNELDLALMTDDFLEVSSFKQSGVVKKKYLLSDEPQSSSIFKYQSMNKLLENIPELDAYKGKVNISAKFSNSKSKITAIYSPISHELQLPFSMALGQLLEAKGRVLFLDLEELSILNDLICTAKDRNLSDLLYEFSADTDMDFDEYIHQFMGFDYINPFSKPDEISQIDENVWMKFFDKISDLGYDNIVVLFGCAVQGFSRILSKAEKLYVLGKPGDYFRRGVEAFDEYIEKAGITVEVEKVLLPMSATNLSEGAYCIEELLQGNLGLFVRRELGAA